MKRLFLLCFLALTSAAHAATTLAGNLIVQNSVTLQGDLTPSQITADQNDYAPANFATAATLRLATDASRNVTGLAGGVGGRVVRVFNIGSFPLVLKNASSSSSAANRFAFNADLTIPAGAGVDLQYDATALRWHAVGTPGSSGGATTFISLTDVPSSYSGQALKSVTVNAGETGLVFTTVSGGGNALTSNPLSQFAATTSAQLAGVMTDETGTGALVFGTAPIITLANGTGLPLASGVTGTLQAGNFPALTGDATTSAGSLSTTVSRINGTSLAGLGTGIVKNTTGTGVPSIAVAADFPTLNQNTTGNAATVTTNANLTGDVTSVGNATTLPTVNANVGTFVATTLNAKGQVTAGAALSGDVTTSGAVATLATVNSNVGVFVATTLNAKGQVTAGTALTGDVTTSGAAATIAANAVTNAKAAQMTTLTLKGNNTGSTANASDLTVSQVNTMLGSLTNPMTTAGDIIIGGSGGTPTRLAAGANSTFFGFNSSGVAGYYTPSGAGTVTSIATTNGITGGTITGSGTLSLDLTYSPTWTGIHTWTPTARSSGVAPYFKVTIPTDTGITAATEGAGEIHATGTRTWATTGTVALQRENFWAGPTYASAAASQTFTDVFNSYMTPPIAGTNAIFTRGHTLGILDATSAASSITGGVVVATTLGTTATSVGIGGGNVNAGGLITGGTITSTGAFTASSTSVHTGTATFNNAATFNGTNATTAVTVAQTARTSGILPYIKWTIPADTGQTAATESPGLQVVSGTRTWATTGTVALQRENFFAGPTYASAAASQTFTDPFTVYITPPVAGTNAIFTRGHSLGIVDSTSASSSITGGFVVATTLGTTATSVGIGGGNINAGGNVTFAGSLTGSLSGGTGLPISTGVSGLGSNVASWLADPQGPTGNYAKWSTLMATTGTGAPVSAVGDSVTDIRINGITSASATHSYDFSSGTGTFKTSLGTNTLGGSSTVVAVPGSLTVASAAITNNIPQNSQSTAYTTVLTDAGKHLYHPSADTTARTFTIDSNANVAYPIGTAITFINDGSAGVITIAITSDTLVLAGAGTTGSRTLNPYGVATAIKVTSTRWIISGTNLQ